MLFSLDPVHIPRSDRTPPIVVVFVMAVYLADLCNGATVPPITLAARQARVDVGTIDDGSVSLN